MLQLQIIFFVGYASKSCNHPHSQGGKCVEPIICSTYKIGVSITVPSAPIQLSNTSGCSISLMTAELYNCGEHSLSVLLESVECLANDCLG